MQPMRSQQKSGRILTVNQSGKIQKQDLIPMCGVDRPEIFQYSGFAVPAKCGRMDGNFCLHSLDEVAIFMLLVSPLDYKHRRRLYSNC